MGAGPLSPVPQVYATLEDAEKLFLSFLGTHAGAGVAGGELVAAAAEEAGDFAYVHRLGAQRALRALGDLTQVGDDVYPGDAPQLVYSFLRVELARAGPLVVGVVHGRDEDFAVALRVGERDADDPELFQRAAAVDPLVHLRGDHAGAQEVGHQLVRPRGDVAETEVARVGPDAGVNRLGGPLLHGYAELDVEVGHDLRARRSPLVDQVVLAVERVVLVVVKVQARAGLGDRDASPVCAGAVDHPQVVAFWSLTEDLLREQPPQVAGDLLGVAQDSRGAQRAHQAHQRGRGAYGIAVRADVRRYGDAVQRFQERRHLLDGVIRRAGRQPILPPSKRSLSWIPAPRPGLARSGAWGFASGASAHPRRPGCARPRCSGPPGPSGHPSRRGRCRRPWPARGQGSRGRLSP